MEFFLMIGFVIASLFIIFSFIGYIVWFIMVAWFAKKAISATQKELDRFLPNLEQLIQTYMTLPENQKDQLKMKIINLLMQANTQMGQLQDIHRQRYELRVSELQGMAASAGIDWQPPL